MIFNLLASVLMSIMPGGSSPVIWGDVPDYMYHNMSGGPAVSFYKNVPKIVVGDIGEDLKNCSTKTVLCVDAAGIFIAIPMGSVGYSSGGDKVSVVRKLDIKFLGRQVPVRLIEAVHGSAKYRYWYSDEIGLVAFSVAVKGDSATYLLVQENGLKAGKK